MSRNTQHVNMSVVLLNKTVKYKHMNITEAKILHGIYHFRELIGEEIHYSAAELNWLVSSSFKEGKSWPDVNGKLKAIESESENDDYLASIGATSAAAKRPIKYLEEAGYITCTDKVR